MHNIVSAIFLAENIKKIEIQAPRIAKKRKAGQFVMIRVSEQGERIPLTIAGSDPEKGTVTIIVQGMGKSTRELNMKEAGDTIHDIVGPLGTPSHIEKFGTAVSIGGGVGTAIAYPTAVALKEAGNYVITINGARTKDLVILEKEMRAVSDEAFITTDDGSYGFHGFVTQKLQELIDSGRTIDYVLAIGPIPMMKAVAEVTRPYGIHTVVSLNPVMVDGTGMCGGCRVTVDNEIRFACVDGPEFDAHKVDFKNLSDRNRMYLGEEQQSTEAFSHKCRLGHQQ
ncbi:MAG: sulfide/dihydroorotate dehydrogenase-like FAD/NAD-binding protein [Chlorobium sp.]|jgi:ferredoxin--NADP+ reductase|uniref:sulfide/dihydroorotate dehydrogenase-like FAD/NAD-binding protein n=1 Tax=Chlorobium sp. TaxID=1095 RepID=UPI001DA12DB5|nr:sulfide/dihydroorotate dehydrogenase-like FAD/NAD-binding protein [Chlorobium sp.]MBN1278809.1 sulfide/dihydroorotate dehydrogenase-like FAD/NAD-binding protein [Chlorobiaceae bacterium]MCF8216455.1 sulfide/dihydroorotate dehydrogenase-like FAD/NAD-binding protein [Chlorobium sp.]MCF8271379.1 sulfide/dihydroorotate dehydrogenase-like FAD/NAD-binding protein [Chlorobium sp.]MCF8287732.1 sulfide/dihydroorotate dehydrogenase-like FAD/NAD-binding protein [Chlorobium sp.]MCF8291290.1 sulfide/dih